MNMSFKGKWLLFISLSVGLMGQLCCGKNVILITVDDMNCDASTFGFDGVHTPNFDRLVSLGTNFTNAYCQYPSCGPSRASFMSGLRPDTIRVYQNNTRLRRNNKNILTLGELFKKNGYHSIRIGKIFHLANPIDIGTDGHDDLQSWTERYNPEGIDNIQTENITVSEDTKKPNLCVSLAWWNPDSEDNEHTDGKAAQKTIDLIKNYKDEKFFIACGFVNPHCPYVAPKKYFDLHPLDSIELESLEEAKKDLEDVPPIAVSRSSRNWPYYLRGVTYEEARKTKRAYYACISFLDAQVGRILDALEAEDLLKTTTIVFVSDHGYFIGEKGLWFKNNCFERSAKVPFIFSPAQSLDFAKGQICQSNIELIDIYPTISEILELSGQPAKLDGKSLIPLLRDATQNWPNTALTQVKNGKIFGYSLKSEKYRYTEWGKDGKLGVELYDHALDPEERVNLATSSKHRVIIKELAKSLSNLRSN